MFPVFYIGSGENDLELVEGMFDDPLSAASAYLHTSLESPEEAELQVAWTFVEHPDHVDTEFVPDLEDLYHGHFLYLLEGDSYSQEQLGGSNFEESLDWTMGSV